MNVYIFFSILICCLAHAAFSETQKIALGVIAPLTGPAASMGESLMGAVKIAPQDALQIFYEDDQCDAKRALAAYQKLSRQGVHVFMVACSGSIMAIAPYAKSRHELIVTSYSGSAAVRSTGAEVIRFNPDAVSLAEAMAKLFVEELPYKQYANVGILYEEQDYATSLAALLKERLGSRIILEESYLSVNPSFKTQVTKLKASAIDLLLFIPVSDVAARTLLREMKELHFRKPILGEVNLCDYPFSLPSFELFGACFSAFIDGKGFTEFETLYRQKLARPSQYPFYDALGFDIVKAINDYVLTHKVFVADQLKESILAGVEGQVANYSFTPEGEVTNAGQYLKLKKYQAGTVN